MQHIKKWPLVLILFFILLFMSCDKSKQNNTIYPYPMTQIPGYRIGKWYSVTPWTNQTISPYLDTIWFINDTLAGWTGTVLDSPNVYTFRKTYFPDPVHIAVIGPGVSWQPPGTIDTTISQCGMTALGSDTFVIYNQNGAFNLTQVRYVKIK